MAVLGSSFQMFKVLAFLLFFFGSVCDAVPLLNTGEGKTDGLLKVETLERSDNAFFEHLASMREKQYKEETNKIVETTTVDASSTDNMTTIIEDTDLASAKSVDPLSLVYYIGSFAALLLFFLVVSCSECCFEKAPANVAFRAEGVLEDCPPIEAANPPPPYDEFAPPDYNTLFESVEGTKLKAVTVFVLPVSETQHVPP